MAYDFFLYPQPPTARASRGESTSLANLSLSPSPSLSLSSFLWACRPRPLRFSLPLPPSLTWALIGPPPHPPPYLALRRFLKSRILHSIFSVFQNSFCFMNHWPNMVKELVLQFILIKITSALTYLFATHFTRALYCRFLAHRKRVRG